MPTTAHIQERLNAIQQSIESRPSECSLKHGTTNVGTERINVVYEGRTIPPKIEHLMTRDDSTVDSISIESPIWMKLIIHPQEWSYEQ